MFLLPSLLPFLPGFFLHFDFVLEYIFAQHFFIPDVFCIYSLDMCLCASMAYEVN